MAFATTWGNTLMTYLFTHSTVTQPPATMYVALHTGANGGDGASNEIVGDGYARQAQTFTVAGKVATGVSNLTWGPDATANWGTVTDCSLWSAASGGTCYAVGTVTSSVAFNVGDSATMAGSALTFTLT